jgi:L-ascorbate metabolism protein UlaG (beta-lactamase superfamily)
MNRDTLKSNTMNHAQKVIHLAGMSYLLFIISLNVSGTVGQDTIAIHNLGHGSLFFEYKNLVIHVDPYSSQADYNALPDADLIFITHGHSDHYDLTALNKIKTDSSIMICTQAVKDLGTYSDTANIMKNGDSLVLKGIPVKAVPAYNLVNTSYHPKGVGNGYIFTFGEKRVYVAGDTENIPEMDSLGTIDIAFLPMNLPYTMSVPMAAEAARSVKPDILYIYHFGTSDTASLRALLSNEDMEIRIGKSDFYESDVRTPDIPNSLRSGKSTNMSFYPNPVRDYVSVANPVSGSRFFLYDSKGQMIMEQQLPDRGEQRIDMRSNKPGVYIIKVQNRESVTSTLIIKE